MFINNWKYARYNAPLSRGGAPASTVAGVCDPICRLAHPAACQSAKSLLPFHLLLIKYPNGTILSLFDNLFILSLLLLILDSRFLTLVDLFTFIPTLYPATATATATFSPTLGSWIPTEPNPTSHIPRLISLWILRSTFHLSHLRLGSWLLTPD